MYLSKILNISEPQYPFRENCKNVLTGWPQYMYVCVIDFKTWRVCLVPRCNDIEVPKWDPLPTYADFQRQFVSSISTTIALLIQATDRRPGLSCEAGQHQQQDFSGGSCGWVVSPLVPFGGQFRPLHGRRLRELGLVPRGPRDNLLSFPFSSGASGWVALVQAV